MARRSRREVARRQRVESRRRQLADVEHLELLRRPAPPLPQPLANVGPEGPRDTAAALRRRLARIELRDGRR